MLVMLPIYHFSSDSEKMCTYPIKGWNHKPLKTETEKFRNSYVNKCDD